MADAVLEADRLDPLECRRYVEESFSAERMVADYVAAYERMIGASRAAPVTPRTTAVT
jgi:hypothetical protein